MASSVFFKFKSQKEPQRVPFDGTGISVFELKREIINISRLGDGTEFDLLIYNEHDNEEYNDDTTIIPRSTTVLARRLPASKPGQGRAARYVSGKMPVNARNAYRTEQASTPVSAPSATGVLNGAQINSNMSEEERIAAIHKLEGSQWEQQKQQMANATPVYRPGGPNRKPAPSDKPLPPHYFCYRCGEKGHHISNCPTNNDPNYDGKPRFKRTTGIPRSFLKEVDKPTVAAANDGLTDDNNQSHGVMRDADGKFVVAVPDEKSWKQYQSKAQASTTNANEDENATKELQDRGLACPIDKRLFADPVKTPCCGTTYCNECIENALINSDLVCPGCSTDNVLIDNLTPDEEMRSKIQDFEAEKKAAREKPKDKPNSPHKPTDKDTEKTKSPSPEATDKPDGAASKSATPDVSSKKRPAEDELENDRKGDPPSPSKEQVKARDSSTSVASPPTIPATGFDSSFVEQMNALAGQSGTTFNPNNPMNMPFPMGMPMPSMMNMPPQMMNPAGMNWGNGALNMPGMNGMPGFPPQWNQQNTMMFPGMGMNGMNDMNFLQGPNNQGNDQHNNWNNVGQGQNQAIPGSNRNANGIPTGPKSMASRFPNANFANGGNDGDAYMRKPVNPHRHQGKQRKARPTDYREL